MLPPITLAADMDEHLMFLCTGNAARSVMAGMMLSQLRPQTKVTTAGTHVIEGQPMSWRTRDAILGAGFEVFSHRSLQVTSAGLRDVDLLVAMAGEHVAYVRRQHPEAAARTATLKRLCRDLAAGGPLPARVAALGLAEVALEPWEDIEDPAGGDLPEFVACAAEIHELMVTLVRLLDPVPTGAQEAS